MNRTRLRSSIWRGLSIALIFFVVRWLLLLIPGRTPEPLLETCFVSAVVGIVWGIFSWLIYPREQRRQAEQRNRIADKAGPE